MILETYQEERAIEPQEENKKAYATVSEITTEGIKVIFDGETEASTKAFYCNSGIEYEVGDRVLLEKINGSYIILCTVGKEGSSGGGETINVVDNLTSTSATDALSANQGRILQSMIPTFTNKTYSVSSGSITAQKSTNSYFSNSAINFLTGFYCSNANIYVNAYKSGSYIYWRAFNISTSAQSGTIYFSYV